MNLPSENSGQQNTLLDSLIRANSQATEVRKEVPYQPVVYAIPEEWRLAEKKLLEEAVKFQPELYRQIRQLATRQEFQQMQDQQLRTIQMEQQEQMRAIRSTLQQDGSVREKYSSDISKLLSDGRRDMQQLAERLERKIRNMILATMAASMVLSILVCLVLRYLIG